jgi:general secretion pathway protein G
VVVAEAACRARGEMNMRKNKRVRRSAFTLLELLLVAGILAVLAAFAIPSLMGQAQEAKIKIAEAAIKRNGAIPKALDAYKWNMGSYPEKLDELYQKKDEVDNPSYAGPYLEGSFEELKDPWGNPYEYRFPGDVNEDSYDLWSWGPNGKDDGGKEGSDDIKNWIER